VLRRGAAGRVLPVVSRAGGTVRLPALL